MTDYLPAVMAMLGPAQNQYADPAAWDRLHAELGIRLPTDYQTLVDAYAPIQLNSHLYLPPRDRTLESGPGHTGHGPCLVRDLLGRP